MGGRASASIYHSKPARGLRFGLSQASLDYKMHLKCNAMCWLGLMLREFIYTYIFIYIIAIPLPSHDQLWATIGVFASIILYNFKRGLIFGLGWNSMTGLVGHFEAWFHGLMGEGCQESGHHTISNRIIRSQTSCMKYNVANTWKGSN